MLPETRDLIRQVAARYDIDPNEIVSTRTDRWLYPARLEIVRALMARGYGPSRIGRIMCRDRHSIRYWLNRKHQC